MRYRYVRTLRSEKRFSVLGVSKGFGAAAPSRRERAGQVAISQTLFDFRTSNELMKKTGIEAVTRANGVYRRDSWRRSFKDF